MSKVFEAIQRLERESGRVLPGVLAEAQHALQEPGVPAEPASRLLEDVPPAAVAVEVPEDPVLKTEPPPVPPVFSLDQIPAANVVVDPSTRIIYHLDPDSPGADRFRLLRMRLWPLWESGKLKTLLVTSAHAQDGKSTVVLNLATALAEKGKRSVLVVEGDLCHPSLSERLRLGKGAGLAECLEDSRNPLSLIRRIEPLGWYLLPAGHANGNPTELLQAPILSSIFDALRPHFDWIVVDTPPVMPLTDTLSLRQCVDAGLLVVRADRTPREAVEAAIGRIGSQHLLGVLLNGSEEFEKLYSDYRKSYGVRKPK